MWDYGGNADGQTIGHRGYIRLHKQRREGGCRSSARPLYSTKTTKSSKYAGSGCGFKSIDMKSMRRNHNFNFLQAQKTCVSSLKSFEKEGYEALQSAFYTLGASGI